VAPHDRPVFLIGFMGSGKTTVGRLVAERLGWDFLDTDDLVVEREGRSIEQIFSGSGEAGFRGAEWEAVQTLAGRRQCVVATGGGLFLEPRARRWLREQGSTVWLDVPFGECLRRVGPGAGRPLWAPEGPEDDPSAFRSIFERRRAAYALAGVRVTAGRPAREVAREVVARLGLVFP
jgi:shikimate kinase